MGTRWMLVFLLGIYLQPFGAFPSGPPRSVCRDGLPIHIKHGKPLEARTDPSPFTISVNATEFQPGDTINIRIHSNIGAMFRGLFVQVRPLPNPAEDVFKDAPVGEYYRRVMNTKPIVCVNSQDTLVHKDPFMKVETKFDWKAPLLINNDVIVRATILKDFETFWTNVTSPLIKLKRDKVLPTEALAKPWMTEIVKTIKAENNASLKRQLVRERFEKGFAGVFDPNGYIMVHYLNDLLPYSDRFKSDMKVIVPQGNSSDPGVVDDSDITVEIPLGVEITTSNITVSDYDKLVEEMLKGDYKHLDQLENVINSPDQTTELP